MNPNEPTSVIESDVPVGPCTSHRHHWAATFTKASAH